MAPREKHRGRCEGAWAPSAGTSILAIVLFNEDGTHNAYHVRKPFHREPDFGATSVNYDLAELLEWAGAPQ